MHSNVQRVQQYFGFLTTVVLSLAVALSLTSIILDQFITVPSSSISLDTLNVRYGRPQIGYDTRRQEYAFMTFDLSADLSSLFNWNTKQLFVYVAATYPGRPYSNKIVVWDTIIRDKQDAYISLKNQTADYAIYDVTGKFNGRNATLSLEWNVQPYVGILTWNKSPEKTRITFPKFT
ncbi:signal peptidase 22 kDa subunit [Lipomyces japonicus]|uniref:signal peptidase 22 kDa subunit n=1 Tax=Lipomyces japonicus TaxID=56871 RepID=UPI0034CE2B31